MLLKFFTPFLVFIFFSEGEGATSKVLRGGRGSRATKSGLANMLQSQKDENLSDEYFYNILPDFELNVSNLAYYS